MICAFWQNSSPTHYFCLHLQWFSAWPWFLISYRLTISSRNSSFLGLCQHCVNQLCLINSIQEASMRNSAMEPILSTFPNSESSQSCWHHSSHWMSFTGAMCDIKTHYSYLLWKNYQLCHWKIFTKSNRRSGCHFESSSNPQGALYNRRNLLLVSLQLGHCLEWDHYC